MLGHLEEARPHFQRALGIEEKTFSPDSYQVAYTRHGIAMLEAERNWREILPLVAAEARTDLPPFCTLVESAKKPRGSTCLSLSTARDVW